MNAFWSLLRQPLSVAMLICVSTLWGASSVVQSYITTPILLLLMEPVHLVLRRGEIRYVIPLYPLNPYRLMRVKSIIIPVSETSLKDLDLSDIKHAFQLVIREQE